MAWNIFNRFYYGKAGQADFTTENLPANRWQLFWQMLRVRLSSLVGSTSCTPSSACPASCDRRQLDGLGQRPEGSINLIENGP